LFRLGLTNVRVVARPFQVALKMFKHANVTIGVLHVDGTHVYPDVRLDYDAWLPFLSERGTILFHDIKHTDVETMLPTLEGFKFAFGKRAGSLGVLTRDEALYRDITAQWPGEPIETLHPSAEEANRQYLNPIGTRERVFKEWPCRESDEIARRTRIHALP